MTDEITQSTPSGEPVPTKQPEMSAPTDDDMPTEVIYPLASGEAAPTSVTETPPDEMATMTMTPSMLAASTPATFNADRVKEAPPPQPTLAYEQFGLPTDVAQTPPPSAITEVAPQPSNQALYAQSNYTNPALYTQNTYTPQPGQAFPIQQATTLPKRSPLLWLILVAIIAFVLGGSSVFAYSAIRTQAQIPSPNGTLQKYCDGVKAANAQEIYDTLSQHAKVNISLADIQRTFDAFNFANTVSPDTSIKYGDCTISDIHTSDALAVATVTLSLNLTFQGQTTSLPIASLVSLVQENNQWKVDFSNLTQPQSGLNFPGLPATPTPSSN